MFKSIISIAFCTTILVCHTAFHIYAAYNTPFGLYFFSHFIAVLFSWISLKLLNFIYNLVDNLKNFCFYVIDQPIKKSNECFNIYYNCNCCVSISTEDYFNWINEFILIIKNHFQYFIFKSTVSKSYVVLRTFAAA